MLANSNPIPLPPTFDQYNLGLSLPTTFEDFNVYVPWVGFEKRAAGIPLDYGISGLTPDNTEHFFPLNLDQYYANSGACAGAASMTGPFTVETSGFVPVNQPLPFTVNFQNDPSASTDTHEVRITVPLDPTVDAESFQLGDIKVGNITVHIPAGHSLFQGDFDFTQSNGFILRVSAGVDLKSHAATWLLQAIDPLTGQVLRDPNQGLLAPNDAAGNGAGYVSYTVQADADRGERNVFDRDGQRPSRQRAARKHATVDLDHRQHGADHHADRDASGRHGQLRSEMELYRRSRRLGLQVGDALCRQGRRRLSDLAARSDRCLRRHDLHRPVGASLSVPGAGDR